MAKNKRKTRAVQASSDVSSEARVLICVVNGLGATKNRNAPNTQAKAWAYPTFSKARGLVHS
eukprot:2933422-Pleurochrysis_carterae.AAC.3